MIFSPTAAWIRVLFALAWLGSAAAPAQGRTCQEVLQHLLDPTTGEPNKAKDVLGVQVRIVKIVKNGQVFYFKECPVSALGAEKANHRRRGGEAVYERKVFDAPTPPVILAKFVRLLDYSELAPEATFSSGQLVTLKSGEIITLGAGFAQAEVKLVEILDMTMAAPDLPHETYRRFFQNQAKILHNPDASSEQRSQARKAISKASDALNKLIGADPTWSQVYADWKVLWYVFGFVDLNIGNLGYRAGTTAADGLRVSLFDSGDAFNTGTTHDRMGVPNVPMNGVNFRGQYFNLPDLSDFRREHIPQFSLVSPPVRKLIDKIAGKDDFVERQLVEAMKQAGVDPKNPWDLTVRDKTATTAKSIAGRAADVKKLLSARR